MRVDEEQDATENLHNTNDDKINNEDSLDGTDSEYTDNDFIGEEMNWNEDENIYRIQGTNPNGFNLGDDGNE